MYLGTLFVTQSTAGSKALLRRLFGLIVALKEA
jgi:hypothetical protein